MAEVYVGTKFQTVFVRKTPPTDASTGALLAWCRQWAQAGWIAKATGNLSCRTTDGFIITPTGTDPVSLTAADFVEVLKATPEVAKHFKPGELEKLCSLDFHLKEVKNRFMKLGL